MDLFHALNEINRIFDYLMTAAVFFFFFFLTVQVSFEVQQFSPNDNGWCGLLSKTKLTENN